ncbi:MAG TPA: ribonuclease E/G [Phenylobacterium sp.]|uniref:Rne/Rng family ribonuclease n=1 Tax=Phenylobacterium sp. TaxID=1871053 RepID=UPI002C5C1F17|nr:ribonuclease E/G [Phenylobacterium sp.]HSV01982.1 ribonuclease E/G [Phenylobacterium sp.]
MTKTMLIDAAHAEETRVVVLDGTRVEEFDFESQNRKQLRGNIYLAKVTRVEPSLQAAFVEYGGNRHGFLAFNEIHPDYYQIPVADREALLREEAEADAEDERHEPRSRAASSGDEDDEDAAQAAEDEDDVMEEELARRRRRLMRKYKIQEVIRRRQIMLVQVVKEERGNKGAALTTYLSLAGRYGVLMPNTARGGGISRKITAIADRKRLKGIVQSLDVPHGMGLIVRTAGAKRTKAEIKRDYEYLLRLWENIRETTLHSIAPALIYEEEDLVKRAIRDLYDKDIDGVFVEGESGFKEARDFMRMLMPGQAKKVQLYREPTPLYVKYKVEDHLSQIYSPVVPLRSGGYLVINQTEALVAVDVNSGRSTRERNIEATALKTNMEAAEEAARQLRLRDLAGLIVIDFIDMDESKNNRAVEKKLKDCLKDDRARVQMGKISPFGLMEISRQRRRTGVLEGTTHVCEHCGGTGRVRSVESSALATLRALEIEALKGGGEATLTAPRAVALYILNEKRAHLARLHQQLGLFVTVVVDDAMAHVDHQIERTSMETRAEHAAPALPPTEAYAPAPEPEALEDYEDEEEEEDEDEEEVAAIEAQPRGRPEDEAHHDEGEGRGRRRRRRRGRRGDELREGRDAREPGHAGEPLREQAPRPTEAQREDEDGGHGRRRRRGRRGGRRMRDDGRPPETFAWTRPWVPYGDDPFVWFDPAEDLKKPPVPSAANDQRQPSRPAAAAETAAPAPALARPVARSEMDDVWVELPAPEDKPKRGRRGRTRGAEPQPPPEPPAAQAPAPSESALEAPVEAAPARKPSRRRAAPAKAAAPEPERVAEPLPELATAAAVPPAAPTAPAAPDPAEIAAPPSAPRRGWWRRG